MSDIYKIKPANLEALYEKIEKLNKKAVKLGCKPAVVNVLGSEMIKINKIMPGGRLLKYEYEIKLVTVTGDTPKLAGWSLVAKIEYLEDEKLVFCVPGESCPEEFRKNEGRLYCDHCESYRNRKSVYILKNAGVYVQVGRTCIKDFLGGVSPERLLNQATWNLSITEACGEYTKGGSYVPETINITEYLNAVAICIRRLGWLSRSACRFSGESPTASDSWDLVKPYICNDKDKIDYEMWVKNKKLFHQERDEMLVADTLAWAVKLPVENVVDYLYNLGVACRAGYVTKKTMGIVASAISAYIRHLDRQTELKKDDDEKSHEWVGEIKIRQDFTDLIIQSMRYIEGQYGTTTLVSFEDKSGNLIKWFASIELDNIDKGDVVDMKATVKKHDEYKGVKQTLVTRAKILKINGEKT